MDPGSLPGATILFQRLQTDDTIGNEILAITQRDHSFFLNFHLGFSSSRLELKRNFVLSLQLAVGFGLGTVDVG